MAPAVTNTNITVSVPVGTVNHGNLRLVCIPPYWHDYIIFFIANYFAHAVTVISTPGRHWLERVEIVVLAMVLPVSGITRACSAIRNHAATEKDPLKKAAKAGARSKGIERFWIHVATLLSSPPRLLADWSYFCEVSNYETTSLLISIGMYQERNRNNGVPS
jgi:hypothetical protein